MPNTIKDNEVNLPMTENDESDLFQRLKSRMEAEACEAPKRTMRRDFLQKIVHTAIPASVALLAGEQVAVAGCKFCDEFNGQEITCYFCDERSGIKSCIISVDCGDCNTNCKQPGGPQRWGTPNE